MEFIFSGNAEWPHQDREQWTDGCNLVAIRPGVAITYERNEKTNETLMKKGYNLVAAEDFLRQHHEGKLDISKVENTIITIPSGELSRARGGSHCMTCPISRG
jgi:arginine deiminase